MNRNVWTRDSLVNINKVFCELNKMQKLYNNISTFWLENIDLGFMLKG